jgi:hypothetical protein
VIALAILVAIPASQIPSWDFRWDPRACCCDKAGPCPCPDHELPHEEGSASMRACGSGGNYFTTAQAPELGLPPVALASILSIEAASPMPHTDTPHAPPDRERPRGPS